MQPEGDFWEREYAQYLREHRHPLNRLSHLVGIPTLIVTGVLGLALRSVWLFVIGQAVGWFFQLLGHRIEGNRPAFLKRPVSVLVGPLMVSIELAGLAGVHFGWADRVRERVNNSWN